MTASCGFIIEGIWQTWTLKQVDASAMLPDLKRGPGPARINLRVSFQEDYLVWH